MMIESTADRTPKRFFRSAMVTNEGKNNKKRKNDVKDLDVKVKDSHNPNRKEVETVQYQVLYSTGFCCRA